MVNDLYNYFNENVLLKSINGKEWYGYVDIFIPAVDSEDEIDEIVLAVDDELIDFRADEISDIQIIQSESRPDIESV